MDRLCPGEGFLGKNCQCYCKGQNAYDIVLCEAAGMSDLQKYEGIVYSLICEQKSKYTCTVFV